MANTKQRGTCTVIEDGIRCPEPHLSRGMCRKHYARWKRTGDPLVVRVAAPHGPSPRHGTDFEALQAPPNEEGCRLRLGAITPYGYGRWRRAEGSAHREAWVRVFGPIPDGLEIDHTCHNVAMRKGSCMGGGDCLHRRCTEITHLLPATHAGNMAGILNAKAECRNGHQYTPENTMTLSNGRHACRECWRASQRAYRERRKSR